MRIVIAASSIVRTTVAATALGIVAQLGWATPASAQLEVCNRTPNTVSIALGYRTGSGWQSEGWWVAGPEACATVYQGALNARYYYLFAVDDIGGGAWDGTVFMCTQDTSFTIFGVEDCLARGYERTGFFELDTGDEQTWTVQLTEDNETSLDMQ
ncbi:DUF1036 domain-containing protein [Pelagibacterium montanilacus]|uniref:DUF1036 domain-containing protein n=1 Tax=Pelagibacterium montanilacus TaxID=2185280 RepID=UPI000F8F0185|nr:DUF1036 domain-containing protein [Pelagibacterium montanilacus]